MWETGVEEPKERERGEGKKNRKSAGKSKSKAVGALVGDFIEGFSQQQRSLSGRARPWAMGKAGVLRDSLGSTLFGGFRCCHWSVGGGVVERMGFLVGDHMMSADMNNRGGSLLCLLRACCCSSLAAEVTRRDRSTTSCHQGTQPAAMRWH